MKKYIGLTIFLIGTILASFWIAISSGKLNIKNLREKSDELTGGNLMNSLNVSENNKIENMSETMENTNQENNLIINDTLEKQDSKLNNIELEYEKEQTSKKSDENLSMKPDETSGGNLRGKSDESVLMNQMNNSDKLIQKEEENNFQQIKEFIFIGLAQANLYTGDKYNDIFSIFELDNLPTYKVEGKEIYIKELNSIEYEEEKNIMERLIQKIGGNIVQTNMFGDKQLFANPDLFYKKEVIMLVEYDSKLYFVVLPYKLYQQYKKFLKEVLFVKS